MNHTYKLPHTYFPQKGAFAVLLAVALVAPFKSFAQTPTQIPADVSFYGQVNKSLVGYADGGTADVGVYDNNVSSTRFGWQASKSITPDLFADVLLEVQVNSGTNSRRLKQGRAGTTASGVTERHTRVGLRHNKVGALYIGRTSTASDGITEIDIAPLSNALTSTPARYGASLKFRQKGNGALTAFQMSQVVDNFDGMQFAGGSASDGTNAYGAGFTDRFDLISYVSPRINGVEFSAAAIQGGDHDFALRYKKKADTFDLQAGLAYVDYRTITHTAPGANEVEGQWSGSVSGKHESGLGATVAYGQRVYRHRAAGVETPWFYWAKLGYSWGAWGVAAEHGHYANIDTTTTANTTLYTYGLGLERDLGHGVGISAFGRLLDLDRQGLAVEALYVYGMNLRVRF